MRILFAALIIDGQGQERVGDPSGNVRNMEDGAREGPMVVLWERSAAVINTDWEEDENAVADAAVDMDW